MTPTQPRPLPTRLYEPNIVHNPFSWMGIWTPQGWRVHKKRFGNARQFKVHLSGDGKTTFFENALLDPQTCRVEWQDDLHLKDDPFTDGGIYPCDPRIEYPLGRPRWAVSHTLLCYPVADHTLYTHEYTWDMVHGHLQTHFRKHVELEEARTDPQDGRTVRVKRTPISQSVEGNVHYPLNNSAVRGVWANPQKQGENFYARRIVQRILMHNGVYLYSPFKPVVQCHGLWQVLPEESVRACFDSDSGLCSDRERLIEQFLIPLDQPKLGMFSPHYKMVPSRIYETDISLPTEQVGEVNASQIAAAKARLGAKFFLGRVGYGAENSFDHTGEGLAATGYQCAYDLNNNGVIDEEDIAALERHLGRRVRANLYFGAYFGGDWLSTAWCVEPNHQPGVPVIADYEFGGGYDAQTGVIRLLNTPGPDKPVWVEYHHDAPAETGEHNIVLHLYHELP